MVTLTYFIEIFKIAKLNQTLPELIKNGVLVVTQTCEEKKLILCKANDKNNGAMNECNLYLVG